MNQQLVIARHINGITLNDYEYILDSDGGIRLFSGKNEAMEFLTEHEGLKELEFLVFLDWCKLEQGEFVEV